MSDIDALVAMINDPAVDKIPSQKRCSFQGGCKELIKLSSVQCNVCMYRFCQSHRLPEIHSPQSCGLKKKHAAKVEAKKSALRKIQQEKQVKQGKQGKKANNL